MSIVFIPEGAIILCRAGHEIAETTRDLHKGDYDYDKSLINWRPGQRVAKRGDDIPVLCTCGEPYFIRYYFPWYKRPEITQEWIDYLKRHVNS